MDNEFKLDVENLNAQLKYIAALNGLTMIKLKKCVNSKYGKIDSVRNLNNKLKNRTFRVSELVEITDILGFDIYLKKR